jgi:YesN/AraC family two-component response regulator
VKYDWLKKDLHFHPAYISRCMKQVYGSTPLAYLMRYRVEQSKVLLMNTNLPVQQVSLDVGFSNATYFIRCFSKAEGMTPRTYRQKFRLK